MYVCVGVGVCVCVCVCSCVWLCVCVFTSTRDQRFLSASPVLGSINYGIFDGSPTVLSQSSSELDVRKAFLEQLRLRFVR